MSPCFFSHQRQVHQQDPVCAQLGRSGAAHPHGARADPRLRATVSVPGPWEYPPTSIPIAPGLLASQPPLISSTKLPGNQTCVGKQKRRKYRETSSCEITEHSRPWLSSAGQGPVSPGPRLVFINKVLLAHGYMHPFTNHPRLLSSYNRIERLPQRLACKAKNTDSLALYRKTLP